MILDCYARGGAGDHAAEFEQWVAAAGSADDPELALAASDMLHGPSAVPRWPKPLDALADAESDLRDALPLVPQSRRGAVLKALGEALAWRELLGGPAARAELVGVCEAALAALAPDDAQRRLGVTETLAWARGLPVTDDPEALSPDIRELIARVESDWSSLAAVPSRAWDAAGRASRALQVADPVRALRLLSLQRALPAHAVSNEQWERHFGNVLMLVCRISAPGRLWRAFDSPQDFRLIADEVLAESRQRLRQSEFGAALTLVLLAGAEFHREDVSLRALSRLRETAPGLVSEYGEAYAHVEGNLLISQGINEEHAGDPTAAVRWFLAAADACLAAGITPVLVKAITYIADLVKGGRVSRLAEVSAWCAAYALRVERIAAQDGRAALQRLIRAILAHQLHRGAKAEEVWLLLQAAKGRLLAGLLDQGTSGWTPSQEIRELLGEERALSRRLTELEIPDAGLDAETMVTALMSEYETSRSDASAGALANLRRAIERRIVASVLPGGASPPMTLADARAALGDRTALLVLYEGEWRSEAAATYCLLLSSAGVHVDAAINILQRAGVPWTLIDRQPSTGHGGRTSNPWNAIGGRALVPGTGFLVSAARSGVQEEPAPADISRDGMKSLAELGDGALRVIRRNLPELRAADVNHLIVVPHGAFHFAPLHLAGPAGEPLADHFVVTYLSNLGQLALGPRAPRREGAAVFALSYADQPGLPYLDSSAAEGKMIADLLGVAPILDGRATAPAVIEALERARWVHLRAHGKHDADAAMFQTVFLSPGGGHDGRLRAHEILPLDLHGLDLVTLGACETSLGRVDSADNVWGLAPALLAAGAGAVIGTLWEVSDQASSVFFGHLYRHLTRANSDVVDAFAAAQRGTRQQCPEYRDWGAFYLNGGLR
jgi:hypothetical protein